jgi:hypothetical protein
MNSTPSIVKSPPSKHLNFLLYRQFIERRIIKSMMYVSIEIIRTVMESRRINRLADRNTAVVRMEITKMNIVLDFLSEDLK